MDRTVCTAVGGELKITVKWEIWSYEVTCSIKTAQPVRKSEDFSLNQGAEPHPDTSEFCLPFHNLFL